MLLNISFGFTVNAQLSRLCAGRLLAGWKCSLGYSGYWSEWLIVIPMISHSVNYCSSTIW